MEYKNHEQVTISFERYHADQLAIANLEKQVQKEKNYAHELHQAITKAGFTTQKSFYGNDNAIALVPIGDEKFGTTNYAQAFDKSLSQALKESGPTIVKKGDKIKLIIGKQKPAKTTPTSKRK